MAGSLLSSKPTRICQCWCFPLSIASLRLSVYINPSFTRPLFPQNPHVHYTPSRLQVRWRPASVHRDVGSLVVRFLARSCSRAGVFLKHTLSPFLLASAGIEGTPSRRCTSSHLSAVTPHTHILEDAALDSVPSRCGIPPLGRMPSSSSMAHPR